MIDRLFVFFGGSRPVWGMEFRVPGDYESIIDDFVSISNVSPHTSQYREGKKNEFIPVFRSHLAGTAMCCLELGLRRFVGLSSPMNCIPHCQPILLGTHTPLIKGSQRGGYELSKTGSASGA